VIEQAAATGFACQLCGTNELTLLGRWMLLNGDLPRQPELVPVYQRSQPPDLGPQHARGRYIASTVCAECHSADLRGGERPHADFNTKFGEGTPATPDLGIVGAYDLAAFTRFCARARHRMAATSG